MGNNIWFWVWFNAGVLILLAADLFIFHRKAKEVSVREAGLWTLFWVTLSMMFCAFVWKTQGRDKGMEFLTGYLIEYSLSVDNIFVFVLIFTHFAVPRQFQHRVLFWGILGALVMRGTMIGLGVVLVESFEWVLYLFGVFLMITGLKIMFGKDSELEPEHNPIYRLAKKYFPFTHNYRGQKFTVYENGKRLFTPLALVLVLVESTDLIFAVDSIPAIFGITKDPFIVYTSNICAILGLRSLYFVLAGVVHKFYYLKYGLAIVLVFIGTKMLLHHVYEVDTVVSLICVGAILLASVIASLVLTSPKVASKLEEKMEERKERK